MANMEYCKFENTLDALRDCLRHIEVGEETSESEIECAKSLYGACKEFIDRCVDYGIRRDDGGYENFEDD